MEDKVIESALEGILFTAGEPVEIKRLCQVLEVSEQTLENAAQRLMGFYRYEQRGIRLIQLERSYQLVSAPEHADVIRRALETRKPPQLSQAVLEVLAVIAYFQPTTRAYVEQVRGVSSNYSINTLLERGLIEECGRMSVPGRPALFRTTKLFLKSFGISSLEELPPLPEKLDTLETEGEEAKA
jgi:segregation and condensation protein B